MSLLVFHHPLYTSGLSDEARFPKHRYRLLKEALEGRAKTFDIQTSPRCETMDLQLVHDRAYISSFLNGTLDEKRARRIGLRPWTEQIVERTLRIVGGSVAATHALFDEGRVLTGNLAGGTHHAFASEGAGYCIFNDIAVCARVAQRDHGVRRVLVIDLDVHQGDGTASIFSDDSSVFTFSIHGEKNFPFRKQASDLDVGLEDGTSDATYLDALDRSLPEAIDRANPDFVIYQAGVDPLEEDHLGRMNLSREGLRARNERVWRAVLGKAPALVLMGGGYARPIERTVEALTDLFLGAAAHASARSSVDSN